MNQIVGKLAELTKWLERQIDGSPETKGRDQKVTGFLHTVSAASTFIELDGIASTYWRSVAEGRLPDDEETVLICMDDGEVWTGYMDAEQWLYVSGDPMAATVTHWMPLPAPPLKQPEAEPIAEAA